MDKSCYGNYMLDICEGHNQCKEDGCFNKTSIDHGACDCKYKECCTLGRQELQTIIRKDNGYGYNSVEQCDFYKAIDKREMNMIE